jgi:hypothetical protein
MARAARISLEGLGAPAGREARTVAARARIACPRRGRVRRHGRVARRQPLGRTLPEEAAMRTLGVIAHDNRKADLVAWQRSTAHA